MQWLNTLLTDPNSVAHIMAVYVAICAIGMILGKIKIFGVAFGSILVLFVGLAASHFGVKVNMEVLGFVRDFGLMIFIFFIGLQVGPSFFSSFKSVGIVLNALMVCGLLLGTLIALGLFFMFSDVINIGQMMGVLFGAVTNTPALGAAQEALTQIHYAGEDIAVGYACAYPLALISLIPVSLFLRWLFKVDLKEEDRHWDDEEKEISNAPVSFHVYVTNHILNGLSLLQIHERIPRPFICTRIMHQREISSPTGHATICVGDTLRIVATPDNKMDIVRAFGKEDTRIDLAAEKSPLVSRRLIVTKSDLTGTTIGDLALNNEDGVNIARVYRAGMQLFPANNLHIQVGDELQCVGPENAIKRLALHLGNRVKQLEQPNWIAIFIGMLVGIVFGSIPIAIPGMPTPLKLGLAGGPLIIAIILGRYGALFRLATYTTNSANLMLRELGISLFLASVGLTAGTNFVHALTQGDGIYYVFFGILITYIPQIVMGIIGRKFFKLNFHSVLGLLAGIATNSPILAYAATLSEKSSCVIAYSTVYPLAMFLRILSGQVIVLLMWSYVPIA